MISLATITPSTSLNGNAGGKSVRPSARQIATENLRAGRAVIPVPPRSKNPGADGWQNLRLTEADVPVCFQHSDNVGKLNYENAMEHLEARYRSNLAALGIYQ